MLRRVPLALPALVVAAIALPGCGAPHQADVSVSDPVVHYGIGTQTITTTNVTSRRMTFHDQVVREVGDQQDSAFSSSSLNVPATILSADGTCRADGKAIVVGPLDPDQSATCTVRYIASYNAPKDAVETTVTLPPDDATIGWIEVHSTGQGRYDVGSGPVFHETAIP